MSDGLEVGCLVRWVTEDVLGVVKELAANRIEVEWDEPDHPSLFNREVAALVRVDLPVRVRRLSNGRSGINIGPVNGVAPPMWRVMFTLDGPEVTVPESDLRPEVPVDPAERLAEGVPPGSAADSAIVTAARHLLLEHRHNDLVSLGATRVDVKPHQVGVVHRVVNTYPHRFLLSDEVGLGKTIEAAMVIKELRARREAQRVLIIVPPNLLRQWQFELKSKFNEEFSILNSQTARFLSDQGYSGNPFLRFDGVLVSERWITGDRWKKLVSEAAWDLVIVDEAHHARAMKSGNRFSRTKLYDLVQKLTDKSAYPDRSVLFLSATPMQLQSYELYSLIEMLDPALFPSVDDFEDHRRSVLGLSRIVEELIAGPPIDTDRIRELAPEIAGWLGVDEDVAAIRLREGDLAGVVADLSAKHLISEVLIRNRKSRVGGFTQRRAYRWEVNLTTEEVHALARVEDYLAEGFSAMAASTDNSIGFVLVSYQKMMASSIAALRTSLALRSRRLRSGDAAARPGFNRDEEEIDDDEIDVVAAAAGVAASSETEAAQLDELVRLLDEIPVDSKAEAFTSQMDAVRERAEVPKVLVFTQFRATQEDLARRLRERGWAVSIFHGQLESLQKERAVDEFRESNDPHVLISTESGGEGRNFQFCNILVNYDLPWNPMRVEQRIGRVDRLGQTRDVEIYNLWVKGTIEERVLDVLEKRIKLFEATIGGLDPILGSTEKNIREILRHDREIRDRELEDLGDQIEREVDLAREAEEKLADLIMDTKSYSKGIAEQVAGESSMVDAEAQERFMTKLLAAVRTHIRNIGDEYQLTFHDPFRGDHDHLFVAGPRKRAVFRADRHRDSEFVEYMAFGHPIIDAALDVVLRPTFPGATGGRVVPAGNGLNPGGGWLLVHVVTVPDIRDRELAVALYVGDDGSVSADLGAELVERALRFGTEQSIPQGMFRTDTLDMALDRARTHLDVLVADLESEARRALESSVQREREKLERYFDYRSMVAGNRLDATTATLSRFRSEDTTESKRVLPMWEARLENERRIVEELDSERHRRFAELDQRLLAVVDRVLVQVVRVEVVDGNAG